MIRSAHLCLMWLEIVSFSFAPRCIKLAAWSTMRILGAVFQDLGSVPFQGHCQQIRTSSGSRCKQS